MSGKRGKMHISARFNGTFPSVFYGLKWFEADFLQSRCPCRWSTNKKVKRKTEKNEDEGGSIPLLLFSTLHCRHASKYNWVALLKCLTTARNQKDN